VSSTAAASATRAEGCGIALRLRRFDQRSGSKRLVWGWMQERTVHELGEGGADVATGPWSVCGIAVVADGGCCDRGEVRDRRRDPPITKKIGNEALDRRSRLRCDTSTGDFR
jgi:hypothetical protein